MTAEELKCSFIVNVLTLFSIKVQRSMPAFRIFFLSLNDVLFVASLNIRK